MKEIIRKILKEEEETNLGVSYTDPTKGIVAPSQKVISDVCEKEKFCQKQGPITFGQLRKLVESAQNKNLNIDIGEGFYKAILRLLPWFFPQIAIAGFIGSSVRAFNKIIRPTLEDTRGYKSWWGKTLMRVMDTVEGDIPHGDPISKIFFISDGLLHMLDRKFKLKFARYMAEMAASKPDSEPVPEYFVENELRKWINQKFLLNPPLPEKIQETFKRKITESEINNLNWLDDWDWTDDYPLDGVEFTVNNTPIVWSIRDIGDDKIVIYFDTPNNKTKDGPVFEKSRAYQNFKEEKWKIVSDNINESEEDDWGWAKEIEIKTDLTPAQIYNRYESFPVEVVGPYIAGQFSDVTYEGGKLYLEVDGWCDFVHLFEDRESNYGRMGHYLAKAILCDDDYWEPYSTSDLVNDWVDDVWHLVNDDPTLFEYIKKYIKENGFIGQPLETEEDPNQEGLREDMLDDNNLLGDLIDEEDMFHDLKMELKWAYGSAYNQAASNNVYEAATDAIIDIFGKGEWIQRKNQRGYDVHIYKFEATDVILESVMNEISDCWSNCRKYFDPEKHFDPEEHESEEQSFEEYCEECVDKPFDEWGDFLSFYSRYLYNRDGELYPSYDEWPNSEDLKEYFREDVYARI